MMTEKFITDLVNGRRFKNNVTNDILHFVNPHYNKGHNLKVTRDGNVSDKNAVFSTVEKNLFMRIDDDVYTIQSIKLVTPQAHPPHKDIIHTTLNMQEVLFEALS